MLHGLSIMSPVCSVLLDAQVQAAHPRLRQMATALQSKGLQVRWGLGAGGFSTALIPS